jgi:hypothetical protein
LPIARDNPFSGESPLSDQAADAKCGSTPLLVEAQGGTHVLEWAARDQGGLLIAAT